MNTLKRKSAARRNNQTGDYDVGYGKPPVHTQFKPGQSGNRKGRPKGIKNFKTYLLEELSERVTVIIDGRKVRLPRAKIVVKSQVAKAMKGDSKAAALVINLLADIFDLDEQDASETPLDNDDQAILDAYIARRITRQNGSSNDGEDGNA